ncbi:DUF2470 domain-containing protein [Streptomyces sp. NBC_01476]|uniref:DUF2470 domain-containing protein n=1 Tax=Streptomyces sp. NBC_01476 TaxID=2903881 RepID=UPI002E37F7C1|nr:DUF2470 domain-containing protein [Streptomyces sp. NBC_01476]
MRSFRARVIQPTAAERVRSILAAAHSMAVVSDGVRSEVRRLDGSGAMSPIHLHEPSGATRARTAGWTPVRLEFTDIAPTPVRDRLRARLTLTGVMAAAYDAGSAQSTCLEFGQAVLEDPEGRAVVTLDALRATDLDPIATSEAGMLTHLMDSHRELVPLLLRLVRPQPDRSVLRALPVAMDRYGITVRLEYPSGHHDVRLPFATPVTHIDQAGPQIQALLAAARRCSHHNRLLT